MQQALFEDIQILDSRPEARNKSTKRFRPAPATEPKRTLFGVIETKAQAGKRAQQLVQLIGAVEDAPVAIECHRSHIDVLAYFIERSKRAALDLNDRDGLLRMVGDTQELLTERECLAMRKNEMIWRPYPLGWLGSRPGQMYAAALHRKEIAYLRTLQKELREEIEAITEGAAQCQAELELLRAVGPLPNDVAERYGLTATGHRTRG